MNLKSAFAVLLFMISITACKKEVDGGACEYITVHKKASVTFIDGDLDAEFMASFQLKSDETNEVYRVTNTQFKTLMRNFDLVALKNKDNVFVLNIKEISKGSCVPLVITEIHLE
ncbi:MAG: hypothetical protein PSN34_12335 [Urechidicola sp.]|nr:hypothetical protein [Urechidicola sp.]